jgi:hypothetical protein
VFDWLSIALPVAIALPAYLFAGLTYLESRHQRELLETLTKAIPLLSPPRPRRKSAPRKRKSTQTALPPGSFSLRTPGPAPSDAARLALQQKAEERRLVKLQLEREREQWKRQKDVAKAIGWVVDHLGSSEEDEEYEEEEDG